MQGHLWVLLSYQGPKGPWSYLFFSSLIEMSFNQIVLLTNGGGVSTIMGSWQSNLKLYCSFAIEINDAPRLIILKVYFWYLEIITIKIDN